MPISNKTEKSALTKSTKNTNKEERFHDGRETIHIEDIDNSS